MPILNIDGTDYDLDTLSDDAKAQIASLQAVDRRIAMLQEELAIHHTARIAYANALKGLLPATYSSGKGEKSDSSIKPQGLNSKISWPE